MKHASFIKKAYAFSSKACGCVLAVCITVYQKTISPDHSMFLRPFYPHGCCKFYPSCSEYTRQAVVKHGVFKGTRLFFGRLRKCHPWAEGGIDLIP